MRVASLKASEHKAKRGSANAARAFKRTPWIRLGRSTGVAPLGGSGVSRFGGGYFFIGTFFLPLFSAM
jgi:hypothetical protein